jgi:pSer/pThr/pTyr-binding forkhead associated (FHA) protein
MNQSEKLTIYLGREQDNDIVIALPSVSRQHAIISLSKGEYRIQDNNSMNGVFVNGQKVANAVICKNDKITLGTTETLIWNDIIKAFNRKFDLSNRGNQPVVGRSVHALTLKIGRNSDNDIIMNDPRISGHHALLYSEIKDNKQTFVLEDRNSRNGTYVNGKKINRQNVTGSDLITLGSSSVLSWDQIASIVNKAYSASMPSPMDGQTLIHQQDETSILGEQTYYAEDQYHAKHKSGTGWIIGSVIALIVILVGIGLFLTYGKGILSPSYNQPTAQNQRISLSHTYNIKRGESDDIAMRRAKIEAQKELMEKTREYISNSNNFATNYSIFPITVENQTKDDSQNAIITDLYTDMNGPDFEAKMAYISQNNDIVSELNDIQSAYDQDYQLLTEAETNLENAYDAWNSGTNNYWDNQSSADWGQLNPEQTFQEMQNTYNDQIEAVFRDMDRTNPIQTQVATVIANPKPVNGLNIFAKAKNVISSLSNTVQLSLSLSGPEQTFRDYLALENHGDSKTYFNQVLSYYDQESGARDFIKSKIMDGYTDEEEFYNAMNQLYRLNQELEKNIKIDKQKFTILNYDYLKSFNNIISDLKLNTTYSDARGKATLTISFKIDWNHYFDYSIEISKAWTELFTGYNDNTTGMTDDEREFQKALGAGIQSASENLNNPQNRDKFIKAVAEGSQGMISYDGDVNIPIHFVKRGSDWKLFFTENDPILNLIAQ